MMNNRFGKLGTFIILTIVVIVMAYIFDCVIISAALTAFEKFVVLMLISILSGVMAFIVSHIIEK